MTHRPSQPAARRSAAAAGRLIVALLVAVVAAAGTFAWRAQQREVPPPPVAAPPAEPVVSPAVKRAQFYQREVEPEIFVTDGLNREAADRCIARLERVLDGYRRGVRPFVEDLTSLRTRLGIVRRMPGDWWSEDDRIETYVEAKFEKHLFSEQQLLDDISEVLMTFREEVDANQKRMLVNVRASLETTDLPEIDLAEHEPFFSDVAERLQRLSAQQGTASVQDFLAVLAVSEAGGYAATSVVAGLLARFGSAAAVSAAAGTGATAGAGAAGAGGGTLAGPVGTVVGLGVGLAVGLIIDWWMTEKFEAEMSAQMDQYLLSLKRRVLHGDPALPADGASPQDTGRTGLIHAMPAACDRLLHAYRDRFYEQIVAGEPSP